ncbi:MAG TPA: hypothetical protein VLA43_06905 [Longimicrobiales bacterium]|nr:hypothetical protein [Longimicrobiales bacterium]
MPSTRLTPALAATLALTLSCGDAPRGDPGTPAPDGAAGDTAAAVPRRSYERSVVFVSTTGDSLLLAPWVVEATTLPGGVARSARGWLARNGAWESFLRSTWTSPPNREPWRILPQGPFRILVGEGDRVDRIFYEGGSRRLEVSLDESLAEWTGNRGGSFNVLQGGLVLGDRAVPGRVLDVSQGIRASEGSMGDWLFLVSGDSVVVVVQAPLYQEEEMAYQGWARDGAQELQWPEVQVQWEESRAYEPARRDVPSVLGIQTPSGSLEGELRVLAMQLETRAGPGPVLPVDGVMEVEGTLRIQGRTIPVRGVLRHRQP